MQANSFIAKMSRVLISCLPRKIQIGLTSFLMAFGVIHNAYAVPAQVPLFQLNSVKPIMMLNMSKDHQMYFKVYDDYSDITNPSGGDKDGIPDTTFNPKYEYYGYFDGKKCYEYSGNNYFEPVALATLIDHYCTAGSKQWSGNFLNWATMTRIDAIRKILYGGLRSTDTTSLTILERAFIPQDAHAFAKFYDGNDISKLTPFNPPYLQASPSAATGITICNVTPADTLNDASQNNKNPPLIRVARGNYSLWASNESRQCQWDAASNANVPASSGINAYAAAPASNSGDKLTTSNKYNDGEYVTRVRVCAPGFLEDECKQYSNASNAKKPTGLFQEFGETGKIQFGLLTGSYGKNKSGGVLRKTIGDMSSEIDSTSGLFTGTAGAISVLNSLRIYGYSYSASNYGGAAPNDDCPFGITAYNNGSCSNWGNPQAEMYLESLRYLSSNGLSANTNFAVNDTARIAKFTSATWGSAPLTTANYCAPLNVLQFNASSSTFDDDELSTASDIGITGGATGVKTWTDKVGDSTHQALSGSYFIGNKATGGQSNDQDGMCTGKSFGGLSLFTGSCPDAPRLGGSYSIAGLAYYARSNDLNTNLPNTQFLRTLGVSLAPAVPSIKIPVPGTLGTNQKYIQVLPACKNNRASTVGPNVPTREGNCAIVDFKIVSTNIASGNATNTAKLYVNWEVAESGNDYDQDMWGTIDISVTSTQASVSTRIINMSASPSIGFGYVISGTNSDGFKAASGGYNFVDANTWCNVAGRCNCVSGACTQFKSKKVGGVDVPDPEIWDVAATPTGATFLPSALELAARWGGYSASFEKKTRAEALEAKADVETYLANAIKTRDISDSYYFATDPRALAVSLRNAFNDISAGVGSATSVATVSAKVGEGDFVYQAQFNSQNWSGDLQAYAFAKDGSLKTVPALCSANVVDPAKKTTICAGAMPNSSTGRTIYINKLGALAAFNWSNLDATQQANLKLASESTTAEAMKRADWLSGNAAYETTAVGGILRDRGVVPNRNIIGDIVNSSPVYVGERNFRYNNLPNASGGSYLAFVNNDKKIMEKLLMVGSNDGMLHAFDANTFSEKFAFIPNGAFPKLAKLSMPDYGTSINPHSYIVDGSLTYSDAYINGAWRRVVAGTMGAGGKSVFALDVTSSSPKLLFEISSADYPSLGYVLGKPTILPMKNGRWAVIFGNGYDSGSTSRLFIVDLEQPLNSTYTKILDAGEGTGLSTPSIEINGNGEAVNVYAGDLNGNLWRFDLQSTSASAWQKSYKLFKAINAGVEQPITASPTLGINSSKDWKTMVYFGTGKYFDVGDEGNAIGTQAFYAIADIGATVSMSSLLNKTMVTTGTTSRELSPKNVNPNWATQNGWYLLFNDTINAKGERVTTKPLLLFDKLIFQTLIPSTQACANGGASWLMEVPAVGDKYVDKTLLSPNEYVPQPILGDLSFVYNSATGKGSLISNPSTVDTIPLVKTLPLPTSLSGRQSWHQVQ